MIFWTTEAGDRILPENMDTQHLINAINYVDRKFDGIPHHMVSIISKMERVVEQRRPGYWRRNQVVSTVSADEYNRLYLN